MIEFLLAAVGNVPAFLRVIILAAIPIAEFRLSVPVGILDYSLSPLEAIIFTFIGGSLIFLPLYFGLARLRNFCVQRLPALVRPLDTFLERGRKKLHGHYTTYGLIGLAIFVAIPLPLTGVWTATFGAVALNIPFKTAATGILSGLLIGSVVVTILTVGIESLF